MAKFSGISTNNSPAITDTAIGVGSGTSDQQTPYDKIPVKTSNFHNPSKFSVYRSASLSLTDNAWNLVACDTALFDTGTDVDLATHPGRFTAPIDGFYHFDGAAGVASIADGTLVSVALYKNGVQFVTGTQFAARNTLSAIAVVSQMLELSAGDTVELWVFNGGTGHSLYVSSSQVVNCFSGHLVSAF